MFPPRIIPARAGFTRPQARAEGRGRDHPRSRGVYSIRSGSRRIISGSSPLARGLPPVGNTVRVRLWIIPARAGFTVLSPVWAMSARDHPRSRGVYFPRRRRHGRIRGSSPLARGLPRAARSASTSAGIIPARAGFTTVAEGLDMGSEDHPRSRGVYRGDSHSPLGRQGSSPLARGLPHPLLSIASRARIIPARAGFTASPKWLRYHSEDHPRSRGVYTCESLESQRTRTLPDPCCLHCRPRARSAELR